jgi:hypothetical protein
MLEKRGSESLRPASTFLLTLSPFAMLEPIAFLNETEDYSTAFAWAYLALSLGIAWASHFHERKGFFYAGLLNTGLALVLIARRYEWFDEAPWAVAIAAGGMACLAGGLLLHVREQRRRRVQS